MSVTKKGFEERAATVFEKKVAKLFVNVGNQHFNKLNISGIFLILFSPNASENDYKFVLNDLFEDIKLFLERASNSDQIKSSLVGYVFLLEVLHSSRWGVTLCQPKIQQFPFLYHFLKKLKMP